MNRADIVTNPEGGFTIDVESRVALRLVDTRKFGKFRQTRRTIKSVMIVIALAALALFGVFLTLRGEEASAQTGLASWYNLEGLTASGDEVYNGDWTAAHPYFPFGSELTVCYAGTCAHNVIVNDRGPYVKGRSLDLHSAPAEAIGLTYPGTDYVKFRREIPGHWDGVYTTPAGSGKWVNYGY